MSSLVTQNWEENPRVLERWAQRNCLEFSKGKSRSCTRGGTTPGPWTGWGESRTCGSGVVLPTLV